MPEKFEILTFKDNQFMLDVKFDYEKNTVWLSQQDIAELFGVDRTRIVRHISDIYSDN